MKRIYKTPSKASRRSPEETPAETFIRERVRREALTNHLKQVTDLLDHVEKVLRGLD